MKTKSLCVKSKQESKVYLKTRKILTPVINGVITILDSAARYPLCWIVGLGALAITLQVTYALGAVRGLGL